MKLKGFLTPFIIISIAGTLLHFVYEWSGENKFVGLFSAVNESVWEHLKLLFFPAVVYSVFEYAFDRECRAYKPLSATLGIFIGLLTIVSLFYTYKGILGFDLAAVDITIYYIAVAVFLFSEKVVAKNLDAIPIYNIAAIILILITTAAFFCFTFYPPSLNIFAVP